MTTSKIEDGSARAMPMDLLILSGASNGSGLKASARYRPSKPDSDEHGPGPLPRVVEGGGGAAAPPPARTAAAVLAPGAFTVRGEGGYWERKREMHEGTHRFPPGFPLSQCCGKNTGTHTLKQHPKMDDSLTQRTLGCEAVVPVNTRRR